MPVASGVVRHGQLPLASPCNPQWISVILTSGEDQRKGGFPMTAGTALLTAEDYLVLPDNGVPTELVRGRLVFLNIPAPRHGELCLNSAYLVQHFLEEDP